MKQFTYRAVTPTGQKIQGVVEAKDEKNAIKILKSKNLLITYFKDQESNLFYQLRLYFSRVNTGDLLLFTRQFATMISSGLPMLSALQLIRQKTKPSLAKVIDDIANGIEGGDTLYKSLSEHKKVFSPIYLSLVKAGEIAGVLGIVLERMAKNLEKEREFSAKVKAAMLYPVIVFIAMIVVGIVMIFFVIPKLGNLYQEFDADLPLMSSIVIGTAEAIRSYWYVFFLAAVVLFFSFTYWVRTPKGKVKFDRFILSFPYFGLLIHKIISTNIIRTLALLIKSGVSIVESLHIVSGITSNTIYTKGIESAAKEVEKGVSLATSVAQVQVFPEEIIQMMAIGEETGKLDEMLEKIAIQFEKDTVIALKALTSAIEPAMIIILGVGVGFLVIAIIVPIYNLTSQF